MELEGAGRAGTRREALELETPLRDDAPPTADPGDRAAFLRPSRKSRVRPRRRGLLGRSIVVLYAAAALVLLACAGWAGYSKLLGSSHLRVAKVEVRGSHFLSDGEVRELLGPAVGENILALDIEDLKGRLRVSPWVADASVRRTLPDTLHVEVYERAPIALAEMDRLYLMDPQGALIELFGPRTSSFDLPIVRGLAGLDPATRRERALRVSALVADLDDLTSAVSEVHVEESDLELVLREGGEVVRVAEPPYRSRLASFLSLRRDLHERCPQAESFDLRFRDRIYVKEPAVTEQGR